MRVDARIARGGVLALWAAFFLALWLTGASARYLGERTEWVVAFGAVVLGLAALLYGAATVSARAEATPLSLREAVGLLCLLVPLAAVALAPTAALGSFAAGRKDSSIFRTATPKPPADPADLSFLDIRVAEGDERYALEAGVRDGVRVHLTGIAAGPGDGPAGTWALARFYVSCCIADAQAVTVPVDTSTLPPRAYPEDEWFSVTGTLDRRGARFVVVADGVTHAERPSRPYLAFRF
jgi:uncharacterized repeat protein (TIGR03943 family)